jgi:hypothetical protein
VRGFALAEAADPLWNFNLQGLSLGLIWLGRFDEALTKIRRLSEIETAGSHDHVLLTRYHYSRSELDACHQEIRLAEEAESDPRRKRGWHAVGDFYAGNLAAARAFARSEAALPESIYSAHQFAAFFGLLDDLDDCFRWAERAIAGHEMALQDFRADPLPEKVRRDPRFQVLLKKMNLA